MSKNIINKSAYPSVAPFLIKAYQLNSDGEAYVIEGNKNLSQTYFEHLQFPITNFWGNYFKEKIDILEPKRKDLMLDVCCGTGTLCLNTMPRLGFRKCIAIDNSDVAIGTLRRRINADQNIEAKVEDITKTSFPEHSIDAVYGNSFLHHIPNNPAFLKETFRILRGGGVMVLTGEPTTSAGPLETVIMGSVIRLFEILRIKKKKEVPHETAVTDIWLYEESSLREMLTEVGFTDVRIRGFGVLVPMLNWPSTLIFQKIFGRSMQPEWYWRVFGAIDKVLFFWLPAGMHSHFVIAARKPELSSNADPSAI
jgi:ubiquinone/menaquinone biosynthesis C-methylase UbiE